MTANLKRFDPAGTDGAAATATGNLTSVAIGGTGAVTYAAAYGMSRGSNMGMRAVAPLAADQANTTYATTAATNGSGQVYGSFENWPVAGSQEFVTLRTSAGNCIRQVVSTAGSVTVQNQAGTNVATLGSISLNTVYRFELDVTPGTTTADGAGRARIYDDTDTLLFDSGALTAGNFGGGLATKTVSILRVGDPTTATVTSFAFGFTQPAIDTDATTPPTITPVPKVTNKTATDPAGVTDLVTVSREVVSADPVGVTEPGTPQTVDMVFTVADPAGLTDTAARVADGVRGTADPIGATDTATVVLTLVRTAADQAGATDQAATAAALQRAVTDPAGATDTAAPALTQPAVDITVAGSIPARQRAGIIGAHTKTATLGAARTTGTPTARTKTGTINSPHWAGRIAP